MAEEPTKSASRSPNSKNAGPKERTGKKAQPTSPVTLFLTVIDRPQLANTTTSPEISRLVR